jgi:hypothetical protein
LKTRYFRTGPPESLKRQGRAKKLEKLVYKTPAFQLAWESSKGKQMLERRDSKRIDLTTIVALSVDDIEVKTQMINYSDDGALFRIIASDHDKVSTETLGKDAVFVLKVKNKPDRKYTGEVIRFFFKGEEKFIALRFWEPYRELP